MTDKVIEIENLSKVYRLGKNHTTFRDFFSSILQKPFSDKKKKNNNQFWALSEFNLEINKGDVVGIIGKNGAGKSTLLKILSRITKPSKGTIVLNGSVGSLLEVGTGFHPELTGYENIFLNGTLLGMTRKEIKSKLEEIVEFSGVKDFLFTPVKNYSSGMYVRLAFAVAANLEPDILIVDEVLSVGDAEFQKKCIGRMNEVSKSGRTVLFVSHHLNSLKNLCNRGVVLSEGKKIFDGNINEAINYYLANLISGKKHSYNCPEPRMDYDVYLEKAMITDANCNVLDRAIEVYEEFYLNFTFRVKNFIKNLHLVFYVFNSQGECVYFNDRTDFHNSYFEAVSGVYSCKIRFPNPLLLAGEYSVKISLVDNDKDVYNIYEDVLGFELIDTTSYRTYKRYGYLFLPTKWEIKLIDYVWDFRNSI